MKKKIKKLLKKLPGYRWYSGVLPKYRYLHYYKTLPLQEKTIFLEAQQAGEINGNILYLLKVLASDPAYKDYRLLLACKHNNQKKFKSVLKRYGITGVTLVTMNSHGYFKTLASAKYLMNDNTFMSFFVKKEGQVYLNTWHGTPLKTLGKRIQNAMDGIGNTQKNFIAADYLLYPNVYTMEHMVEDYMLENLSNAKILLAGYPRNTAFFQPNRAFQIAEKLGLEGKKIYAYMPTWRGVVGKIDAKANVYLQYYLHELDKQLTDEEVLFVNLHPIAKKDVDFRGFTHIRNFPADYETYDFLNCAQCLITDYSSVFYDFAVTGKKCVLFTYDEEEYFADRGVYKPLSALPFPSVKTVDALLSELRTPKQYDDTAFLEEYCHYDHADAAKAICDYVVLHRESSLVEVRDMPCNGKPNVLFHVDDLAANEITQAWLELLGQVDREQFNYFVTFPAKCTPHCEEVLLRLPKGIGYFPQQGLLNLGWMSNKVWKGYGKGCMPASWMLSSMKNNWQYEWKRIFGNAAFSHAVQYTGQDVRRTMTLAAAPCHTLLYDRKAGNKNMGKGVRKIAGKQYDTVVPVSSNTVQLPEEFEALLQ